MADYVIVLDSPTGMEKKLVRVYLESDAGEYRQIERTVRQEVEVEAYIQANFDSLWAIANALPEYEWLAATESRASSVYKAVALAMIQAAKGQSATLDDVIAAAETEILNSGKSGAYNKLKSMAGNATAAKRDNFFLIVALMVIGDSASF